MSDAINIQDGSSDKKPTTNTATANQQDGRNDKKLTITNDTAKGSSSNSNNTNNFTITTDTRACAACKYQRRRCAPDCAFAPYFPPDNQKQFLNAHRLFGLRNMMKVYKSVKPQERDIAIKAMIFEANVRANDPVRGCCRIFERLHKQIELCKAELDVVLSQLDHIHNLGAVGVEPVGVFEPTVNPGYIPIAQPTHFPQHPPPEHEDFGGYADLYSLGLKDEDIEAITSQVDVNTGASPIVGLGDAGKLADECIDIKTDPTNFKIVSRFSNPGQTESPSTDATIIITSAVHHRYEECKVYTDLESAGDGQLPSYFPWFAVIISVKRISQRVMKLALHSLSKRTSRRQTACKLYKGQFGMAFSNLSI